MCYYTALFEAMTGNENIINNKYKPYFDRQEIL